MDPLKCPSNFWRTLEIPLPNCEVNRILNWYNKIVLYPLMSGSLNSNIYNDWYRTLCCSCNSINSRQSYLESHFNIHHLKLDFTKVINWNKYQARKAVKRENHILSVWLTQVLNKLVDSLCYYLKIMNTKQVIKNPLVQL